MPLALGVITTAFLAGPIGAFAGASRGRPMQSQIRKAVRAAESSSSLWATVNICDNARRPRELGLRGEMPALGFATGLYMDFQVDYRAHPHSRFKPVPGTRKRMYLGQAAQALHQSGVTFTFRQRAVLAGTITFVWKLGGKTIGRATRTTTAHHKHVDFSDPRGHSAATCVIK